MLVISPACSDTLDLLRRPLPFNASPVKIHLRSAFLQAALVSRHDFLVFSNSLGVTKSLIRNQHEKALFAHKLSLPCRIHKTIIDVAMFTVCARLDISLCSNAISTKLPLIAEIQGRHRLNSRDSRTKLLLGAMTKLYSRVEHCCLMVTGTVVEFAAPIILSSDPG